MAEETHSPIPSQAPAARSGKALAKAIFAADLPQEYIRTIPAQSLYLAIKQNGLGSSSELFEIASVEQCRLLLDFDCWDRDAFNEDNFWEWLGLGDDEESGLRLLQKLLKSVDLKLISLLVSRYTDVVVFDEPTEKPPGAGYYTPDKGYTWLAVHVEDQHKHFLLSRLLALIFETNAELFYQLLATPKVATSSLLEEESYQDRSRRLTSEGIPDHEYAYRLNSPLDESILSSPELKKGRRPIISDVTVIEPLLHSYVSIQPLTALLSQVSDAETAQAELTLIMNAALVNFSVPFHDFDQVALLVEKVKGAANLGLQLALARTGLTLSEAYDTIGLQKLYRIGLGQLSAIRKKALSVSDPEDPLMLSLLDRLRQRFPEIPAFFDASGNAVPQGKLEGGSRAITDMKEVEQIGLILNAAQPD